MGRCMKGDKMKKILICISVLLITVNSYAFGIGVKAFNKEMQGFKGEFREEQMKGFANLKSEIGIDIRTEIQNTLTMTLNSSINASMSAYMENNLKAQIEGIKTDITAQIGVGNKSHNQGDIVNDPKIVYGLLLSNSITVLVMIFVMYKFATIKQERNNLRDWNTNLQLSKKQYKEAIDKIYGSGLNIINNDKGEKK